MTSQPQKAAEFCSFAVDSIVDNSVTDFDLFLKIDDHLVLYGGSGYKWIRDELDSLLRSGHSQFLLRRSDLSKAGMYKELAKLPQIEKNLSPKERIKSIEQVGAKFIECLYAGELTEACVSKAETIASAMVNCISEDKSCITELSGLADHDYYTYYHSVRVASYAVAVTVALGLDTPSLLEQIAVGGLFHDLGKRSIPLRLLNKSGPLNDREWDTMRAHPKSGHKTVNETILAHVPLEIVLHHHEKRDGSGYPDKLDRNSLLYEVQITTLADIFDALTSSRSYQNKRNRFEALSFIKHRLLHKDVCPEAFSALVGCLAS